MRLVCDLLEKERLAEARRCEGERKEGQKEAVSAGWCRSGVTPRGTAFADCCLSTDGWRYHGTDHNVSWSLDHSFTRSLAHSPTHSRTHTHSLTRSLHRPTDDRPTDPPLADHTACIELLLGAGADAEAKNKVEACCCRTECHGQHACMLSVFTTSPLEPTLPTLRVTHVAGARAHAITYALAHAHTHSHTRARTHTRHTGGTHTGGGRRCVQPRRR